MFQLADDDQQIVYIGYGGGRTPFGLRSAIVDAVTRIEPAPVWVRYELTHGYLSRWEELIMIHHHDHGRAPTGNEGEQLPAGRIDPGAAPSGQS